MTVDLAQRAYDYFANDFVGCLPKDREANLSLVCKVFEVDGRPAVSSPTIPGAQL